MEPVDIQDDELENVGELDIAEYVVFLISLDTYTRYVYEHKGEDYTDDLIKRGVVLVRMADRNIRAAAEAFFLEHLSNDVQKKMVSKAFKLPNTSAHSVARRTMLLRTTLKRGGPGTLRALFKDQKAIREVKAAMTASMMDDADAALDKLAAIPMRNARLRKWIDDSAAMAGSKEFQNPVSMAAAQAVEAAPALLTAQNTQAASPGTEDAKAAVQEREALISQVQTNVTLESQRAMAAAGIEDKPPTASEVHGIVAATVAAALASPEVPANLPEAFINKGRPLDSEQVQAALTDGRVLVAAGAGAGKSTTLVSRIAYLINNKGANAGRIVACSFNKKAADQLAEKIKDKIGANAVTCRTMDSLFRSFVVGNKASPGLGSAEEKAMFSYPRFISDDGIKPAVLTRCIMSMWENCKLESLQERYGYPEEWLKDGPPPAKKANQQLTNWRGNDISLEKAKELVSSKAEAQAYIWYEMYMGLKGDIPGWKPPCQSDSYDKFKDTYRKGGEKLGDFGDIQTALVGILRTNPAAKERLQNRFDHILVDEAQDLNTVQHTIFDIISEKVTPTNGKSVWMIGDDKQCIYQFRGSRPELFTAFADKEGWQARLIRTNYRCAPEIVEAANKLSAHNKNNLKMECRAAPHKTTGTASITVDTPEDTIDASIGTLDAIVKEHQHGVPLKSFAVLARTNNELNDFETACIINETPYIRKGGVGFMHAAESRCLLGFIDLANGTSYKTMAKSMAAALMMPHRGTFAGEADILKAIEDAMTDVARKLRVNKDTLDPRSLLEGSNIKVLAEAIKRPGKAKAVAKYGERFYAKTVMELATALEGFASDVRYIEGSIKDTPNQTTEQLLNLILDGVSGTAKEDGKLVTRTLRESITTRNKLWSGDAEDESEDDSDDDRIDEEKAQGENLEVDADGNVVNPVEVVPKQPNPNAGLGAVQYLFKLAVPNSKDIERGTDPSTASGFLTKMEHFQEISEKLRIDPIKWEKEHGEEPPPAVTLSTIHKVKGAEWENVTVLMPKGKFPMPFRLDEGDPDPTLEQIEAQKEAERNLGYVALTRAQNTLKIVCPKTIPGSNAGGISEFVTEAGLKPGENVVRPEPVVDVPVDVEPVVKTGACEYYGEETYDIPTNDRWKL